jgi:hypothetical protein
MEQAGVLQNDGGTEDACRANEKGEPTGGNAIRDTQVGCTLAPAIKDQQLMPDQRGFGNHGTHSPRPCQPGHRDDHMSEQDGEVAHPGNGNNTSQATVFRPIWQFAIDRRKLSDIGLLGCPT